MTLIEIIVALAIAVLLFGAAVWGVGALTGANGKDTATQLAGTIQGLYETAALTGRSCRLVISLPARNEVAAVRWRTECAKGAITASAQRDEELRSANEEERHPSSASNGAPILDGNEASRSERLRIAEGRMFAPYPVEAPIDHLVANGVNLEVWTTKQRQPVSNGLAYIYFFPQGYTERTMIWIRQGTHVWTLQVAPLTGKTSITDEALSVPRT